MCKNFLPQCFHYRMAEPPSSTLQTFPKFTELNDLVNEKVKSILKKNNAFLV